MLKNWTDYIDRFLLQSRKNSHAKRGCNMRKYWFEKVNSALINNLNLKLLENTVSITYLLDFNSKSRDFLALIRYSS